MFSASVLLMTTIPNRVQLAFEFDALAALATTETCRCTIETSIPPAIVVEHYVGGESLINYLVPEWE